MRCRELPRAAAELQGSAGGGERGQIKGRTRPFENEEEDGEDGE